MDNNYKEKLVQTLVSNIHKNYNELADVLKIKFDFPPLEPVRYEICLCIMCGFNQAAITLTNHFFESSLKKLLILYESRSNNTSTCEISSAFVDATEKYAKKNLKDIIDDTYDYGLIDSREKDVLHHFRKEYRNPYSHANPKQMFSNGLFPIRLVHVDEIESVDDFYKFFEAPNTEVNPQDFLPIQGLFGVLKSDNCSKDYFLMVDEIVLRVINQLHS